MQTTPSEPGRAGSGTEPRADPPVDRRGDPPGDVVPPRRERRGSPAVVLRARLQWWLPAFVLPVLAAVLVALGRRWGIGLALLAVPFVPAFWIRIEMTERRIRRRDWRRRWTTVELDTVDALRLRRLPFAGLQWLPRGYRVGRFWSVPLTLRLQHGDEIRLDIRCVWWDGWRELARYVAARPGIDLDARTRGRLGRYVGPIAFAPPAQP